MSVKDTLRDIWAQILQDEADMFSDDDIFFEVGGDSVSAQRLITIAAAQGILLTMEQIFLHASLEAMATVSQVLQDPEPLRNDDSTALLDNSPSLGSRIQEQRASISSKYEMAAEQLEDVYPCTPMQQSLVAQDDSSKNDYVRQFVFRLSANTSVDQLQRAWEETVRANPVLRTRIFHLEGTTGYLQAVIDEGMVWSITRTDLVQFLEEDALVPMQPGDLFFRYTIVQKDSTEGAARLHFVWTAHHALCDGFTVPELLEEVSRRYRHETVSLREPFQSFIHSPAINLDWEKMHQFWSRSLSEDNPAHYPSIPAVNDFQANPSAVFKKQLLLDTSGPVRVTRAQMLRGAWAILMAHYTGSEHVGFGAINNGRAAAVEGLSHMTGPTINAVPIVLHVDPQQSVASFLSTIRTQASAMVPFEHSGLSKIREILAEARSTAADFQTLTVVHSEPFSEAIAPSMKSMGLQYLDELGKKEQHSYPLVASFTLCGQSIVTIKLEFDERVLSEQQAHNLTHQLQTVLKQLSHSTEDTLLGSISPLSANDLDQIRRWNAFVPPAEETTADRLFQAQVHKQPTAIAVCSMEQALTYSEVDAYSSSFAYRLIEVGVSPGMFIALCFEKSIWTVVCILAIFKVGAVYVPIDPEHPPGRIKEVITSAQIRVVMASAFSAKVLRGLPVNVIVVDELHPPDSVAVREFPTRSSPFALAYLLFTSGSTGTPKGILISHSAICTSIKHHGAAFEAGPHWRTLQFASHTFDLSIGEFLTTLAHGGCICVPFDDDRINDLAGVATALNANTLLIAPTVAGLLRPNDVPTVERIVLGGEPISQELIKRWAEHVDLTDSYGPSECSVWSSANLKVSVNANPAHIGHSIGCNMWIVNPEDYKQLSAIGCVGEIVISGAIVGSGYIMDKATTDAAFVPAPDWLKKFHSTESGKTLYRTGDLGKYNPDGSFHIIGRRDTQVKLHGLRIELGEIENQIMTRAHGLVQAAFAALPQTGPCSQHIVAVVCSNLSGLESHSAPVMNLIPSTGSRDSLEKLKTQISYVLPEYMIPSVWIAVEKMPLLISGKIDRRSLKHWIENMSATEYRKIRAEPEVDAEVDVIPGSTAEKLRQVWSEVLEVPAVTISLTTSFFSLGGDSIAAIHVVSRAKKAGLPVAVRNIIRTKTLGNLATVVELNATSTSADSGPSNAFHSTDEILKPYQGILQARLAGQPAARIVDAYPTSPFQREIMRQRLRNRPVFLLSWQMEVFSHSSKLSLDGMAVAWRRVVQKYPILRTIFLRDTTGRLPLLQVVLEGAEPHITMASASADEAEPTFETTNTPHVDDCFLPHRVQISQHGERVYVNIELDHQVIDGWSLKLIKSALLDAYEAKDATNLGEAPSYKAFIAAHRPDRVAADNQHWATALRHQRSSLLSLPLSYQEAQKQHNIHKTVIYLPEIKTQSLMEFGVRHGITAASIFDAAWAQTLSAYTGSADVSFEYIVSGRHEDIPDVLDIVGPLINAIPYHLQDVSSEESPFNLAELAQKMQEQRSVDSLHNSSNVREVLEQNLGTSLPFNTALNFQRRPTAVDSAELRVDDHLRKSRDPWHVSCGISRSVFTPQPQDPMGSPAFRPPPNICCTPANDRDPISLTFSSGCYILRTIRPSDPRSSSMPHCLTSSG